MPWVEAGPVDARAHFVRLLSWALRADLVAMLVVLAVGAAAGKTTQTLIGVLIFLPVFGWGAHLLGVLVLMVGYLAVRPRGPARSLLLALGVYLVPGALLVGCLQTREGTLRDGLAMTIIVGLPPWYALCALVLGAFRDTLGRWPMARTAMLLSLGPGAVAAALACEWLIGH